MAMYRNPLEDTQALVIKLAHPQKPSTPQADIGMGLEKERLDKPESLSTMEMEVPSMMVVKLLDESRKHPTFHVPKIEDDCVNKLWEEINREKIEAQMKKHPLIEKLE